MRKSGKPRAKKASKKLATPSALLMTEEQRINFIADLILEVITAELAN